MTTILYSGEDKRECLLTVLRWAKHEGFDIVMDPAYADDETLEREVDYALDWLNEYVPDSIYDLEVSEYGWRFSCLALEGIELYETV